MGCSDQCLSFRTLLLVLLFGVASVFLSSSKYLQTSNVEELMPKGVPMDQPPRTGDNSHTLDAQNHKSNDQKSLSHENSFITRAWSSRGMVQFYLQHPLAMLKIAAGGIFPSTFKPERDIPDLSGKTILVTGGNNGLGKETVFQLAKHNPSKLFLASRSENKASEAIASIKASLPASNTTEIVYLPLDLTSLASIRTAASQVRHETQSLDLLILNAGIMAVPPTITPIGFEIQLATNHIGHFYLTRLLLPLLLSTASSTARDVRVISLSSEANNWFLSSSSQSIPNQFAPSPNPMLNYAASKAANIYFASELARRYADQGITSVSLHPGVIHTDLYLSSFGPSKLVKWGIKVLGGLVFQSVPHGALTTLWCATVGLRGKGPQDQSDPGAKPNGEGLVNGAYYIPVGRLWKGHPRTEDSETAKVLWDWTEEELERALKEEERSSD